MATLKANAGSAELLQRRIIGREIYFADDRPAEGTQMADTERRPDGLTEVAACTDRPHSEELPLMSDMSAFNVVLK